MHCIAQHCTILRTALNCTAQHSTQHSTDQRCIVLHKTAQHYILRHTTEQYCTTLTELQNVALYCTTLTLLHNVALYCTTLHLTAQHYSVMENTSLFSPHCTAARHYTFLYCKSFSFVIMPRRTIKTGFEENLNSPNFYSIMKCFPLNSVMVDFHWPNTFFYLFQIPCKSCPTLLWKRWKSLI